MNASTESFVAGAGDLTGRQPSRVLLIDDEAEHAEIVGAILRRDGYDVEIAEDGPEGIERALCRCPDLVVLDLYMPTLDGFATAERLRSDPRTVDVPILFMSACGDTLRGRGLELPAIDYLPKPFHAAELLARVARMQRRAPRSSASSAETLDCLPTTPPASDAGAMGV